MEFRSFCGVANEMYVELLPTKTSECIPGLDRLAPQRIVLPGINLSLAAIGSSLRLTVEAMRSHHNGLSAIRK